MLVYQNHPEITTISERAFFTRQSFSAMLHVASHINNEIMLK